MSITPLPTPPSRDDPTNFATRADAFLGALPTFATEANDLATEVNANASAVTAIVNVTKWVSGTTYTQGAATWSPITYLTYRRKITGAGTTDPSADSTNWGLIAGLGNVTELGVQTLTNKTLTAPAITGGTASGITLNDGYTEEVFAVTGTTPALSPNNGSIQTWTLTANSTPTAGTWVIGQSMTLLINDGAGFTVTWSSLAVSWKSNAGSAPALNTSTDTVIVLWKVGSTIYGARVGDA